MKTYTCKNCNKESNWGYSKLNLFCSNECQGEYRFLNETLVRFEQSLVSDRKTIRKCLAHLRGYTCCECGISEHNNKPITLQVDHINGNPSDNRPENLRLLCPNCHSQTDSWSGGNKGSGRKSRGISLG